MEDEEQAKQAENEIKSSYSEARIFFPSHEISDPDVNSLKKRWFDIAGKQDSCTSLLQDFLVDLSNISFEMFQKVVNMTDDNVRN